MSMPTLMPTFTYVESPTNKVVRHFLITPQNGSVNGHIVSAPDPFEVELRYGEDEIVTLHRDSEQSLGEAIEFARRSGKLPKAIVTATAECVRERLRRA